MISIGTVAALGAAYWGATQLNASSTSKKLTRNVIDGINTDNNNKAPALNATFKRNNAENALAQSNYNKAALPLTSIDQINSDLHDEASNAKNPRIKNVPTIHITRDQPYTTYAGKFNNTNKFG